jgi:DNA-directed RNA polymerase specialized sigma24 family protein
MTTNADELPGLTLRLNNYKSANPEERAQLWEDLFPALKRLARNKISAAGLQGREHATELVLSKYEELDRALGKPEASWKNRKLFFSYAAISMRRHLVGQAKKKAADELLDENLTADEWSPTLILALEDAIETVRQKYPRHMEAFMLRYYLGNSHQEILEVMSDSYKTAALLASDLTVARKALRQALTSGLED